MKNIYTKLCLSAIGCLMMASCDFLDVVPQGTATVDDIYRTQYQAEGMVLSCYANIPNYFHPQQFPDFTGGNEIITSKGGTRKQYGKVSAIAIMCLIIWIGYRTLPPKT